MILIIFFKEKKVIVLGGFDFIRRIFKKKVNLESYVFIGFEDIVFRSFIVIGIVFC